MLSTATISAVVAIIGIIFKLFVKKANYKNVGDIMLGFAILMVGMQTMSGAVSPLKDNPHFVNLLTKFENPLWELLWELRLLQFYRVLPHPLVFCRHCRDRKYQFCGSTSDYDGNWSRSGLPGTAFFHRYK